MTPADMGSCLRGVREMRAMSMRKVAEEAGISTAYLQKLERGEVNAPSPHILHALAGALNIPYAQLMQLAGYIMPSESDTKDDVLAHALSSEDLTADEAAALASYLAWYRHDKAKS